MGWKKRIQTLFLWELLEAFQCSGFFSLYSLTRIWHWTKSRCPCFTAATWQLLAWRDWQQRNPWLLLHFCTFGLDTFVKTVIKRNANLKNFSHQKGEGEESKHCLAASMSFDHVCHILSCLIEGLHIDLLQKISMHVSHFLLFYGVQFPEKMYLIKQC